MVTFDHWHRKQRPDAEDLDGANRYWIAVDIGLVGAHVSDVDRLQCRGSKGERDPGVGAEQHSASFDESGRVRAMTRRNAKAVAVA